MTLPERKPCRRVRSTVELDLAGDKVIIERMWDREFDPDGQTRIEVHRRGVSPTIYLMSYKVPEFLRALADLHDLDVVERGAR